MGRRGQGRRKNWLVNDNHGYLLGGRGKRKEDVTIVLPSLPSHLLLEEVHGDVIGQLSTHTEDDTLRLFQLIDLHHRFKRDLVKIQPAGEQSQPRPFYSQSEQLSPNAYILSKLEPAESTLQWLKG